jgi:multiple sugar transport system substrate-binding protein
MLIDGLDDDTNGFGLNLGERYVLYKKFMAFAWGNGGGILDADGSVVFDSDQNLEALEFYQALAEYSLKEKQEVLDYNFKTGRLGMQISGAWNLRNYALEAPHLRYRVALVPRPRLGSGTHGSFAGAEMLVLFKDSKHKDNALKLARFLQEYEQAKKICLEVKSVFPASKRSLDDPVFVDDERVRVFLEQSLTSQTAPAHPGWIDMEDVINRSIEEVLYGRVEPKQSLQTAAQKLEDVVERFE